MEIPDLAAKRKSKPSDKPFYDLGPHTTGVAINEIYAQNFEFSGYVDLCERSYNQLGSIDPRLERRLPYSGFLHSMCNVLNAVAYDTTVENGERKLDMTGRVQHYLLDDQLVPGELYEYLTNISNVTNPQGEEIKMNLPDIAVPHAATDAVGDVPAMRAGSFGLATAETHNVYECYISPLVTAGRVEASRDNVPDWRPLPEGAFPPHTIPNQNLLGYGPIDTNPEGRARLQGIRFQEDGILGRFKISQELLSRVNVILFELKDRHKMVNIGVNPITKIRNYVKRKTIPANLLFVETRTSNQLRLSLDNVRILSNSAFGSSQAGHANIDVMHRHRVHGHYGHCYTTDRGNAPANWNAHANANFHMEAPI